MIARSQIYKLSLGNERIVIFDLSLIAVLLTGLKMRRHEIPALPSHL